MTMDQSGLSVTGTFDRLKDAFFRYYDTPFGLSDRRLQDERRELFDRDGGIYRRPMVELRPEYVSAGRTLDESVKLAGAPADLAEFAAAGLIPPDRPLYEHQESALTLGVEQGRNVVLTAGTGSGKTESFLLPILASLLDESAAWQGGPASYQPWWKSNAGFIPQRQGEHGRAQAVRAIVLYPMNALVDDQLIRLRRALDSDGVRSWLDQHRRGHRFYFGRFTGSTPVTGSSSNGRAVEELRRYLREVTKRSERAQAIGGNEVPYFVPRLDGAEMRSRWDMLDAPPDVLITNYSMLNVMLLRERDGRFFDSTAKWLKADKNHRFTLAVDELHTYRGTAGTEIALLLRNLMNRLGIPEGSPQLRILAASASLDPVRDRGYLQEFFGIDQETFEFLPGRTVRPEPLMADISSSAQALVSTPDAAQAVEVAEKHGAHQALFSAFYFDAEGRQRPQPEAKSEEDLRRILFPGADAGEADRALERLLTAAGHAENRSGWPKLRSHLFFRNVPGVWACTDPSCPEVSPPQPDRTVGKLYGEPATRCSCGSRVLELLYCQNCGDVMLGGFVAEGVTAKDKFEALLLADIPELSRLPDQVRVDRTAGNYLVYWPREQAPESDPSQWVADSGRVQYAFKPAILNPASGGLKTSRQGQHRTGWLFHVRTTSKQGAASRDIFSLQPYPTKCPNCADDWEIRYGRDGKTLPHTDPARQRSPIRGMRTGFEKINQVLVTELASQLPEPQRKLIVFTDSRQDAAKLSAGLDLRHYQDLLRILLYEHIAEGTGDDVSDAKKWVTGQDKSPEKFAAIKRLRLKDDAGYARLSDLWLGAPEEVGGEQASLEASLAGRPTLRAAAAKLGDQLLAMGINPGGPAPSVSEFVSKTGTTTRWSEAYDWTAPTPRPRAGLSLQQQELKEEASFRLGSEVVQGLFSGAGRDFESLGLGWLTLSSDTQPAEMDSSSPAAIGRASLRVLADLRRFQDLREGQLKPHKKLRTYWEAVAEQLSRDPAEVAAIAEGFWGDAVKDYIINPAKVVLRPAEGKAWVCQVCRRQHLHRGAGRCTRCRRELPVSPAAVESSADYYAWKAVNGLGRFRLHCAELTGQTDRADAQSRQSRFQGVFLSTSNEEDPRPDGVDLLSVTTTMEAGVDIGALEAVVLGNMPPTRFNYQQRVGRAGRRSSPVAVALTVCRGRSHDEYYFERPHLITNEPTPKPYLALEREEIFVRALHSEVLRMAFLDLGPQLAAQGLDLTHNVHGQFGLVDDWPVTRPLVESWIAGHHSDIAQAAAALARQGPPELRSIDWAGRVQQVLVQNVTHVVGKPVGHAELSQRLAESGALPMFGFPTRVRYLHLRRPTRTYPWPPAGTVDRDLAMAVSQFAPLSEVVRDGRVYPVIGVAAFKPIGNKPQPESDSLGLERMVAVCRACSHVAELEAGDLPEQPGPCPRCSAPPGVYAVVPLREPLGFRAGRYEDFDGNFSWSARAMSAKARTDLDHLAQAPQPGIRAYSGPGTRYVVNDNGGSLYRFVPAASGLGDWGGWVSVDAIERGKASPGSAVAGAEPVSVALGAVQPTDFLFIGPDKPVITDEGLRLNLVIGARQPGGATDVADGRRAAWYSLAFLFRTVAAAALLDVQQMEFGAGIYSGLADGEPSAMAFLSDTLENGAGFCTYLGSPDVFPKLLDAAENYLDELRAPHHASECTASCYRCLRDYSNMAYHALLDWRLAGDLLTVMRHGKLAHDLGRERLLLAKWADAYGAEVQAGDGAPVAVLRDHPLFGTSAIIARHPLEAAEQTLMPARLAMTAATMEATVTGLDRVVFADSFALDRNPAHVLDLLEEADAE
ncbi:DEAD/DEAH box helicase [Actinoplanes sp. NPDC049599]|uniref:DEAD/DEAH box helicase n=1 Tax=Actinoplanes sp. NPDC049599 TaxID=3363903 RepID=UPI0037AF5AE0